MARVQYGSLIKSLSGSVAGHTFQQNAYGHSLRTKPSQTASFSALQQNRRAAISAIQQAWNTMSDYDRNNWNNFITYHYQGANHNKGSSLSSFALFLKYNLIRYLTNGSVFTHLTYWNAVPSAFSPTLSISGGNLIFNLVPAIDNGSIYAYLFLSQVNQRGSDYRKEVTRYIVSHNFANSAQNITAAYIALFGFLPVPGDKIHARCVLLNVYSPVMWFPSGSIITVT
jgi:hypothetical protein